MSASLMIVLFGGLITLAGLGTLVALGVFFFSIVMHVRSATSEPVPVRAGTSPRTR